MIETSNNRPDNIPVDKANEPNENNSNNLSKKEKHMSYDDYKVQRNDFVKTCVVMLVLLLGLCVIPGVFIWAAIASYDSSNQMSGSVTAFIVLACSVVIVVLAKTIFRSLYDAFLALKNDKECYIRSTPNHELQKIKKKQRNRRAVTYIVLGAVVLSLITVKAFQTKKTIDIYTAAEQLIAEEQYSQACSLLESILKNEHKDTEGLMCLCKAHVEYEAGHIDIAYNYLNQARFNYLSKEQQTAIDAFKKEVKVLKEQKDKKLEEYNKQRFEERIKSGTPFVGMPESRIGDTALGKPSSKVRHNKQVKNGNQYTANLYDFYQNGQRIFVARCVQGEVIQIWDYRDKLITENKPKNGTKKQYDFTPNAEDYSDAEDLYYWYYDDFYDFEEAEDFLDQYGQK